MNRSSRWPTRNREGDGGLIPPLPGRFPTPCSAVARPPSSHPRHEHHERALAGAPSSEPSALARALHTASALRLEHAHINRSWQMDDQSLRLHPRPPGSSHCHTTGYPRTSRQAGVSSQAHTQPVPNGRPNPAAAAGAPASASPWKIWNPRRSHPGSWKPGSAAAHPQRQALPLQTARSITAHRCSRVLARQPSKTVAELSPPLTTTPSRRPAVSPNNAHPKRGPPPPQPAAPAPETSPAAGVERWWCRPENRRFRSAQQRPHWLLHLAGSQEPPCVEQAHNSPIHQGGRTRRRARRPAGLGGRPDHPHHPLLSEPATRRGGTGSPVRCAASSQTQRRGRGRPPPGHSTDLLS